MKITSSNQYIGTCIKCENRPEALLEGFCFKCRQKYRKEFEEELKKSGYEL